MTEQQESLSTERLLHGGFELACCWGIDRDGLLGLQAAVPGLPGVYAFAVDGIVQYVGVASTSLSKRLYFYGKPGPSQTTNIRLNAMLRKALDEGQSIEVYVATPPELDWNGWPISGPEGLEAGIIKRFVLPWNRRGTVRPASAAVSADVSTSPPAAKPLSTHRKALAGDKYAPLREHLSGCTADTVSMTFAEIQAWVGPLPKSATLHRAWWANHEGNTQAKGWMPARYIAEPNPAHRSVLFRKFSY